MRLFFHQIRLTAYWFSPVSSTALFGLNIANSSSLQQQLSQAILLFIAQNYVPKCRKLPVSQKLADVVYDAAINRKYITDYPALQDLNCERNVKGGEGGGGGLWNTVWGFFTRNPQTVVESNKPPSQEYTEWLNVYV